MSKANLLLLNIVATLSRMAATIFMGLWTTRIAYQVLGKEGFGSYAAGLALVTFLMLVVDALSSSVQRHIAHALGKGESLRVAKLAGGYVVLSACLAAGVAVVVALSSPWLASLLTVPAEYENYLPSTITWIGVLAALTVLQAPFRSYLIARQSIVLVSLFDLLDAIAKLGAALALNWIFEPTIEGYAMSIATCVMLPTAGIILVCFLRYPATRPRWPSELHAISSFGLWLMIGAAGWKLRTQGALLLINALCGVVGTAAYTVGLQLAMYQNNLAAAVYRAARPAVVSAHGRGAKDHVKKISRWSSKLLSLCSLFLAIPVLFETRQILLLWIGEAPELTVTMVQLMIVWMSLKDLTIGHVMAIHAEGRIAKHEVLTAMFDLAMLIVTAIAISWANFPAWVVPLVTVFGVISLGISRAAFFQEAAKISFYEWLREVWGRYLATALMASAVSTVIVVVFPPSQARLAILVGINTVVVAVAILWVGLDTEERRKLSGMIQAVAKRFGINHSSSDPY